MNPIVVIPARMASSRLPGKPLADIHGVPMVVHVLRRGLEAKLGPTLVAAGDPQIIAAVHGFGAAAVLTDPGLASGSDRGAAALDVYDPARHHDVVVNLQGDMPTIDPALLREAVLLLDDPEVDIATLACPIRDHAEADRTAVVKVAMEPLAGGATRGRALYFSRSPIPHGAPVMLHHIGLYVYRRDALDRFVAAPPSYIEQAERLEQLRALALGMTVAVAVVDTAPLGVDTPEDLEEARRRLAG